MTMASSLIKQLFVFGLGDGQGAQDGDCQLVHNGGQVLDVTIHTNTHMELANA